MGQTLLPYLPPEMPVIALQAPDLIKECSISTVSERAEYYCKILVSQFEGRNPSVHLLGYSFGGPLAYEMALCLKDSPVNCKSVCLIDPVPICNSPHPGISQHQMLLLRAKEYDILFFYSLQIETNLQQGVILNDIVTLNDLEVRAS